MQRALSTERSPAARAEKGERDVRPMVSGLLACGILSSLFYAAIDVAAGLRYEGYSFKSQTISELSAIGAPTRPMWLVLSCVYSVLVIAFGMGVFASAGGRRRLRFAGGLLVSMGALGLVAWPFAPMHQREALAAGGGTMADTMHLVLSGVSMVITFTLMGIGVATFSRGFRLYSVATAVVLLIFGTLTSLDSPKVADNESTPWLGVNERIMYYGFLLWFVVLAVALLRSQSVAAPAGGAAAAGGAAGARRGT